MGAAWPLHWRGPFTGVASLRTDRTREEAKDGDGVERSDREECLPADFMLASRNLRVRAMVTVHQDRRHGHLR